MKKFIHSHPNIVIGTLAVVLVVILISFYSWAIGTVFTQMSRALTSPSAQSAGGFNLSEAAKLDFRGLMNGAPQTSVPAASVPAPTSALAPVSATPATITSLTPTTTITTVPPVASPSPITSSTKP